MELSAELIFGCKRPAHVTGVQTVGGSGALRVCAELLVSQGIENMYIPNPSWANHKPLLSGGGCKVLEYPYLDEDTHTVDIEKMLSAIRAAPAKSAILFQVQLPALPTAPGRLAIASAIPSLRLAKASDRENSAPPPAGAAAAAAQVAAHNPTGVDLTDAQWDRVLALMTERRRAPRAPAPRAPPAAPPGTGRTGAGGARGCGARLIMSGPSAGSDGARRATAGRRSAGGRRACAGAQGAGGPNRSVPDPAGPILRADASTVRFPSPSTGALGGGGGGGWGPGGCPLPLPLPLPSPLPFIPLQWTFFFLGGGAALRPGDPP